MFNRATFNSILFNGGGKQSVTATGIASAEAFGVAHVHKLLSPTGIGTAEVFGAPSLALRSAIIASGIASAQAFGTLRVGRFVFPSGVASLEAFGVPKLSLILHAVAIGSAEAFGAARVARQLVPTGIASLQAFGVPRLALVLVPSGIASAEGVGRPALGPFIVMIGIPSAQAFGAPNVIRNVRVTAISSLEGFGVPLLYKFLGISPTSIQSREAFGVAGVSFPIHPVGIASALQFGGQPTLYMVAHVSNVGAIASAEAEGVPRILRTLAALGIASGEAEGVPRLNLIIYPASALSAFASGLAAISTRNTIAPSGVASAAAFGAASLRGFNSIAPAAIATLEAFGQNRLTLYIRNAGAIASAQALGLVDVIRLIRPSGIAGAEAFGNFTTHLFFRISPSGIISREAFGNTNFRMSMGQHPSLITPYLVSVERATYGSSIDGVSTERWFVVLDDVAADLQPRDGSNHRDDRGRVRRKRWWGAFNGATPLRVGDRIAFDGDYLQVVAVRNRVGHHLEVELVRIL